jgi:hypothetical protein
VRGCRDRLDLGRPNGTGHRELVEVTIANDLAPGLPKMVKGDIGRRVSDQRADDTVLLVLGDQDQRSAEVGVQRLFWMGDELLGEMPDERFLASAQARAERASGIPGRHRICQRIFQPHARHGH